MIRFNEIFSYIKNRQHLIHKQGKLHDKLHFVHEKINELEKPFIDNTLDIEKYRKFFKKYYIYLKNEEGLESKYIIHDIFICNDFGQPYYSADYEFIENDKHEHGKLSLRYIFHILDLPYAKLKKR